MTIQDKMLSRLRRGAAEAFVLRAFGVLLLFTMHSLLGRIIGTEGYGVFSYGLTMATVLATFVPLGWPTALMRFVAQYLSEERWNELKGVLRSAHQVTLVSSLVVATTLWLLADVFTLTDELFLSIRFTAVLLPLITFVSLRSKAFQGLNRVKASIVLEENLLPILVIAGLFFFRITSVYGALVLFTSVAFIIFLLGSIWLWQSIPLPSRTAAPMYQFTKWMNVALPMVFGGLGQVVLNRSGILILGAMVSTQAVGLYSAASRIANLNIFALAAINTVVPQMLASVYYKGRIGEFRVLLRQSMLLSGLASVPLCLIMLIWPRELLTFFGAEFVEAARLLQILAVGQFINAITGPVGFGLLMTGREREFALISGTVAIANVMGNIWAISIWGSVGAAAVTAVSVIVKNGLMYFAVQHIESPSQPECARYSYDG